MPCRRRFLCLSFAVLAFHVGLESPTRAAESEAEPTPGLGPFSYATEAPFVSQRLSLRPAGTDVLDRGRFRVRAVVDWANTFAYDEQDQQYRIDQEAVTGAVLLAAGVGARIELEVGFENRRRFGGILDGLVQEFHDLLGLDQAGRELFPEGDFAIELTPLEGPQAVLGAEAEGDYARSLSLALRQRVLDEGPRRPALAYRVTFREPLRASDLDHKELEWAIDLAASKRWRRFVFHLSLGWVDWGGDRYLGFRLRDDGIVAMVAAEWNRRPSRSWLLQLHRQDPQLFDYRPFDQPIYELLIGWKGRWGEQELEVALLENFATATNSPDFGFHFGFAHRF